MPIHRDLRHRYPGNWRAISLSVREKAGYCCETCGVCDAAWGFRDQAGEFHALDQKQLLDADPARRAPFTMWLPEEGEVRVREIVLTVAHLDHQPDNNDPKNLRALCQRCHLNHDRSHNKRVRASRRHAAMATPDLLPAGEAA